MKNITDKDFNDLVVQYMTDEEQYEIELLNTKQAIEKFIKLFGEARWAEICKA